MLPAAGDGAGPARGPGWASPTVGPWRPPRRTRHCSRASPPNGAERRGRSRLALPMATGRRRRTGPDPIAILVAQAATRVQELVPIRYGRMLVSPFTFYRGAAAVMAADLAATPDSGITVQACGDAHISNFGGFAAPDRRLVFGPNDFDETLPGPWEWDVKRMAASVEIAGRDIGLAAERAAADRGRLRARVPRGNAWLRRREPPRRLLRPADRRASSSSASAAGSARRTGSCSTSRSPRRGARRASAPFEKLTERVGGELRFRSVPPLLRPVPRALRLGRGPRRGRIRP